MAFSVSDRVRKKCLEYDVHLAADAQFGHEGATSIAIEGPATISAGLFDFDLLAGFSYMGDLQPEQGSFVRHANLIGRFCSIAGGVAMGAPEHPTHWISSHTIFYGARRDWRLSRDFQARNARQTERAVQHYVAGIADALPKVQITSNIKSGRAEPYAAPILSVSADEVEVLLADAAT